MNLFAEFQTRVAAILKDIAASGRLPADLDLGRFVVEPTKDAAHGDLATNAAMVYAKEAKASFANPRELATEIAYALAQDGDVAQSEVAGPGFLNFRLKASAMAGVLEGALRGEHGMVPPAAAPRTVVVDFSSPNVAKPMHVGHIRSTVLGDALSRTLRLLGHRVVTDNHIGDWGTQFGMLLVGWKTLLDRAALEADAIAELERLYKAVNGACTADPTVRDQARAELKRLFGDD